VPVWGLDGESINANLYIGPFLVPLFRVCTRRSGTATENCFAIFPRGKVTLNNVLRSEQVGMKPTTVVLMSSLVVLLGGSSLLAEARRGPACYRIQFLEPGTCSMLTQEDLLEKCDEIKANYGCYAEVESASCGGTADPMTAQITCNFPG
jgi:hypothetical protein